MGGSLVNGILQCVVTPITCSIIGQSVDATTGKCACTSGRPILLSGTTLGCLPALGVSGITGGSGGLLGRTFV